MKLFSIANMLLVCSIFLSSMQLNAQHFTFPAIPSKDGSTLNATLTIKGIRVLNDYGNSFNFEVLIEVNNKFDVASNTLRNNAFYNYAVSIAYRNTNVKPGTFQKNWSGLKQVDTVFTDKTYGPYTYKGGSPASLGLVAGVLYTEPSSYAFLDISGAYLTTSSPDFYANVNADYILPPAGQQPLAVTLTDFSAKAVSNVVSLEWTTSYEKDSKSFVIERSENGHEWYEIANVASKSDNGIHDMINLYEYVDGSPIPGNNYYRLKMLDYFDEFEYSKIVNIQIAKNLETAFVFYPNPVQDVLRIQGLEATQQVTITNAIGQVIARYGNGQEITTSQIELGIYTINILDAEGKIVGTSKIMKR